MFADTTDYLYQINNYCYQEINERLGEPFFNITPNRKDHKNFNLTDSTLIISFEPYVASCYADGVQIAEITYKKLKNVKKYFVN